MFFLNDLYPYCSKCDAELNEEEKMMNKQHENLFYPICDSCLEKHVKELTVIAENIKDEE